jgi:hypothetical protein
MLRKDLTVKRAETRGKRISPSYSNKELKMRGFSLTQDKDESVIDQVKR